MIALTVVAFGVLFALVAWLERVWAWPTSSSWSWRSRSSATSRSRWSGPRGS